MADAATAAARRDDQIAALQRNVAALQSALQDKSSESAARQAALAAATAEQARLDQTIGNLEGAIAALEARSRQQESELAAAAKAADLQANDLASQTTALAAAEVTNEALGVELAALELRIKALSGDLQQSEATGETAAALAGLRAEEIQTLSVALKAANAARATLEDALAKAEGERDALSLQAARQAATLAELKESEIAAKALG